MGSNLETIKCHFPDHYPVLIIFKVFFLFWCGPLLKSLFNLLQYCFSFMLWFVWPRGIWDPSSPTSVWTCTLCFGRPSLNHWIAREAPHCHVLKRHRCDSKKSAIRPTFFHLSPNLVSNTYLANTSGCQSPFSMNFIFYEFCFIKMFKIIEGLRILNSWKKKIMWSLRNTGNCRREHAWVGICT